MINFLLFGTFAAFLLFLANWVYLQRHLIKFSMKTNRPSLWKVIKTFGMNMDVENFYNSIMSVCGKNLDLDASWFGPKLVVLAKSPETMKVVFNSPHTLGKGFFFDFLKPFVGEGLLTANPATWKTHRKLIRPTFNPNILDSFVEIFAEGSIELAEKLQQYDGIGIFNLEQHLENAALQLICETAMGLKDLHQKSEQNEIAEKIDRIGMITLIRMLNIFYHPDWIFFRTKIGKELIKLIQEYNQYIDGIVIAKRFQFDEKNNNSKDEDTNKKRKVFLDFLLEISEEDPAKKLTNQEIFEEVATFIFGGTDTTAVTLGFIFCMLAMHPEVQEKVYHEAVDILGPDRVATAEDLSNFKYTERVIKETLRLFPIAPISNRRVAEDLVVNDKVTVPKGAEMVLFIMQLHMNPKYFPDPLVFKPDRFLPEEANKRHPYSYVPFTAGPRNCIGMNYAMRLMKVFISTLVRKYQFFTEYTKVEDIKFKWNIILKIKHGHKVFLVSRK